MYIGVIVDLITAYNIDVNQTGTKSVWIPPTGRPYWVIAGQPNVGPHLTDKRLKRFGLIKFLNTKFDKVWAKSCALSRAKKGY